MNDILGAKVVGHVLMRDPDTHETILDQYNAINYENISIALAKSLSHKSDGNIHTMWFGNGASSTSGSGQITYLPPRVSGTSANLYNPTYYKVIDDNSPLNNNSDENFITVQHVDGTTYTDITITCLLDFGEPSDQAAFDNATDLEGSYVFDEIALKTYSSNPEEGLMISHIIFSPTQKSLNRRIEIIYTIRISMV